MEQSLYKIGEVAARLGLADKNNNTLRSWTEEFGEFLSVLANPPAGQLRRFTERDLHVLMAVREYRTHHLSYDEIRERLRAGAHTVTSAEGEPGDGPSSRPASGYGEGATTGGSGQALVSLAQYEALLAPLAASVEEWRRLAEEYRTRLEAREERIDTLERRLEDLYARLDAASAAPAPNGEGAAKPHLQASENEESLSGHPRDDTRPQSPFAAMRPQSQAPSSQAPAPERLQSQATVEPESGIIQAEQQETAPLFPLPVIEPAAANGTEEATTPAGETPRRAWWRRWRR
jgi:DNA-binding transcriptional MerR regulator